MGSAGGPLSVVNSRSREEWRLAGPALWLVKVKVNLWVARILSFLKSDEMTSQAKTSSTAALVTVPSLASPAVVTPQFITSLVQSKVQVNTTSLLGQLDRRIAAALRTQGTVGARNSPTRMQDPLLALYKQDVSQAGGPTNLQELELQPLCVRNLRLPSSVTGMQGKPPHSPVPHQQALPAISKCQARRRKGNGQEAGLS